MKHYSDNFFRSDTESADHNASEVKQKKSFISVFKKNQDKVTTIQEEAAPKVIFHHPLIIVYFSIIYD